MHRIFVSGGLSLTAIGLVLGLVAAVALVPTWLPARQATTIDPILALRAE